MMFRNVISFLYEKILFSDRVPLRYLSCYWPDFNQTVMVGSWDPLEQIPTVILTFVQATVVLATIVHIRNTSAVTSSTLTKQYS